VNNMTNVEFKQALATADKATNGEQPDAVVDQAVVDALVAALPSP
jgi:hypothetical protein